MKECVLLSALCASLSCEGGVSFRPLREGDIYQPLQEGGGILPLKDGDSYILLRNSHSDLPLQVRKTYRFQQSSLIPRPLQDVKIAPPLQDNPPQQDGQSWLPLKKSNNDQSPPDGDTFRPRRDLQGGISHHHPQDGSSHHANKDSSSSPSLQDVYSKVPLKSGDSDRPRRDSDTGGQFFRGQVALNRPGHTGFRSGGRLVSGGVGNSAPALPSGGLVGSPGLGHGHLHLGPRLQPAVAPPFTVSLGLGGGHTDYQEQLDSFNAPAVPALLRHTDIHAYGLGHTVAAAPGAHSAALISPAEAPVHAAVAAPVVHSTHLAASSNADLQGGINHHRPQDGNSHHANKDSSSSPSLQDVYSKVTLKSGDSDRPRRDSDTGGQFFPGTLALHRPGHTGFRSGGRLVSGGVSNIAPALPSEGLVGNPGLGHGHLHQGPRLQPAVAPPFTVSLGLGGGLGHTVAAAPGAHSAALIRPAVALAFSSSDDSLEEIIPYRYVYAVHDSLSGSHYDVSETDDGTGVRTGSYSVSLPDGRTQHVVYTADTGGYTATVTYEGTAVYPNL